MSVEVSVYAWVWDVYYVYLYVCMPCMPACVPACMDVKNLSYFLRPFLLFRKHDPLRVKFSERKLLVSFSFFVHLEKGSHTFQAGVEFTM